MGIFNSSYKTLFINDTCFGVLSVLIKLVTHLWVCGLESTASGHGQLAGSCEYGNEPLGGEFLDQPSNYQLFKKDPDLWR